MKVCSCCKKKKSELEFHKRRKKSRDGLRGVCRECMSKYHKEWYLQHPKRKEMIIARNNRVDNENRTFVLDYFESHPCRICGESDPIILEFHHLRDKKRSISDMMRQGYSKERLLEEIYKCEVLCANCHRKITSLEQDNWKISS